MKNLPNIICVIRIILIVPILILTLSSNSANNQIALILFLVAAISDFLDGYIARKYNFVTNLGKLLDPIADKLLVLSIFIAFLTKNQLSIVFILIVLARELTITGLRSMAAAEGVVIQASIFGKLKTITQMSLIILLYLNNIASQEILVYTSNIFVVIVAILTIFSGVDYIYKSKEIFTN